MFPVQFGSHRSQGLTFAAGVTGYLIKREHIRFPIFIGPTYNSVTGHLDFTSGGTFDDEYHGSGLLVCMAPQVEYKKVFLMPHLVHHERGHTRAGRENGEGGQYGGESTGITAGYLPWGAQFTYTFGSDGINSYILGWSHRFAL